MQKLHEQKYSLEQRIKQCKKNMKNIIAVDGKLIDYCEEVAKLKNLEFKLDQADKELRQLINPII